MDRTFKANISERSIWRRLCFMLLFAAIFNLVAFIVFTAALVQFIIRLTTGSVNTELQALGPRLGQYIQQIVAFETFHTEQRPYPFAPFPEADGTATPDTRVQAG
ncbi:MAG: DUF4389 domain-containing protein [Proteobacteria bacterium]|nr:DUF4389 domain-containing protein [Pseudomonadota bacterium]